MTVELKEALASIKDSVEGEIEDAAFYTMLLSLTSNKEDIEIINSKHGLYISSPFKSKTNVAHPTEEEFRRKIQEAIIEEYKNIEG